MVNQEHMRYYLLLLFSLFSIGCNEGLITSANTEIESRTLACVAPQGLTTTNVTSNSISVKWNQSTSATKYRLEWTSITSGEWSYYVTTDTTWTIPALYIGHTYRVRVKSLCDVYDNGTYFGTSSLPSDEIQVTTINASPLCIDIYEDNNNRIIAKPIVLNSQLSAKISKPITVTDRKGSITLYDEDWFIFNTSNKFVIDLYDLPQNYDVELYKGKNGVFIASSKNSGTTPEKITYITNSKYDRYYVRVFSNKVFNDTICYKLKVSLLP